MDVDPIGLDPQGEQGIAFSEDPREAGKGSNIIDDLFPPGGLRPIVTTLDGHPHTLACWPAQVGVRIRCLGVTEFGQSWDLADAYQVHGIDTGSIADAALTGRQLANTLTPDSAAD